MENYEIYKDIETRCNGNIYIGVVGPVRTGKSTFIKAFMDRLILPNIQDPNEKQRVRDELPQSGDGKMIMTTEPKFIPGEAVKVSLDDNAEFSIRMIDCVGYMAEGAMGHMDGDVPRMVSTPWSDEKIPFEQAAETGTRKVIADHSSIGIVIATDGTVTDLPRSSYLTAEKRVIDELKELNKPFVVVLNTSSPTSAEATALKDEMEGEYSVPVIPINCKNLKGSDIENILTTVLYEFPITEIKFNLPGWIDPLPKDNSIKASYISSIIDTCKDINKLKDVKDILPALSENENTKKSYIDKLSLSDGSAVIDISLHDNIFYNVLSETTGTDIASDSQLISTIKQLSEAKKEYDKIKNALNEVNVKGYGAVAPQLSETELEEPTLIKQGNSYGIKMKARSQSLHLIKANVETEVSPIVGTEEQSKELLNYLKDQYENDRDKIWNYNIFGKTLADLVNDGLNKKLNNMPEDTQQKLCSTIEKIINHGSGGIICILL